MAEHNVTVETTLKILLDEKKFASLRDILVTMNPADIAAIFEELETSRLPLLFRLFAADFPAQEESKQTADHDNRRENRQLIPCVNDHRSQNLSAHLEQQRQRNALRQTHAQAFLMPEKADEARNLRDQNHDHARSFHQKRAVADHLFENSFNRFEHSQRPFAFVFVASDYCI